ncbi:hypothetical protein [Bernardetia sp.]|uniref:hypothetical protein n=1 Tax=Bernardetia sp. TaxID=1937974 RepID=UPI0025C5AB58|nr:hypothetical protein [Bernardetia sp.]
MKNHNNLSRYEQEAEEHFNNYYGDEEDFDELAGYDDYDEDYDDEDYDEDYDDEDYDDEDYDEDYDDVEDFTGAASVSANTGTNKTGKRHLTFRIKNDETDAGGNPIETTVTLFGAYGSYTPNPKVPITLDEGDYPAFLSEIAANPHTLVNPRYRVKVSNQYANSFLIRKTEASGQISEQRIQPQNYEDPRNNIQNLILMNDFGLVADGRTSLTFKMEAGEEISLAFEIAARVNNTLLLTGGNAKGKKGKGCECKGGKRSRRGGRRRRGGMRNERTRSSRRRNY